MDFELGRVDIKVETSLMASCMVMPRHGNIDQLFHIFAFLRNKHSTEMVLEPSEPEIDQSCFEKEDWSTMVYSYCSDDIPPNAPKCRGFGLKIRACVDCDHAGDSIIRRSRTGFIVFLNSVPIYWTSKKQGSIETR